ncbi:hypothetical protein TrST_g802 [Triparma strigata]|uniref:Uncharacterized protein n=1 Tax=Triparma strigata TaxID=1606541 RepID=A0A9W7B9N1_9STRA|nr:hypothetical protein TrST_g802 [Triparma strigata]
MSSDEDEAPKAKRRIRRNRPKKEEDEESFLTKKTDKDSKPTTQKKRRKAKGRGKSPKPKKGGDENDENEEPSKKKKGKKGGDADEESDSDIENDGEEDQGLSNTLFNKLKGKGSTRKKKKKKKSADDKDDEDESPDEAEKMKRTRKSRKSTMDTDDEDDEDGPSSQANAASQKVSLFGGKFPWLARGGSSKATATKKFKMWKPQWYKNKMKNTTLPFQMGLRPLQVQKDERDSKPLPKNYAGSQVDDVISILITSMENLVDDPIVVHPLVRIHCVDVTTGKYLERVKRKGQKFESATTQFEKQTVLPTKPNKKRQPNKKCTFVPPVCTLPWRLSGVRGANPQWHEQIQILESYTTLLSEKTLLLFEILDFGPTVPIEEARKGEGYYRIAWGFLKTRGANGAIRVGVRELPKGAKPDLNNEYSDYTAELAESQKVCRLQLYKYQNDSALVKEQAFYRGLPAFVDPPATPEVPRVFLQYLRQKKVPYASSMTVIIGPVSKPRTQIVLRRPNAPWEHEKHKLKFQQLATVTVTAGGGDMGGVKMDAARAEVVRRGAMLRARKPTEQCVMPTKLLHRLHAGEQGALTIKFNNSGSLLAVACSKDDFTFPIRIYDSESGNLRHEFVGHHSLVYDMQWSLNDKYLVSASADGTSKVFCLGGLSSNKVTDSDDEEDEDAEKEKGEDNEEEDDDDDESMTSSLVGKKATKKVESPALRGPPFLMSTLQHNPPVFLYSATFQPPSPGTKSMDNSAPLVLTGSYDSAIRLWDPVTGSNLGLTGGKRFHDSYVNAMVFDHKTGRLYSGDGVGCIIIWRKQGQSKTGTDYVVMRKIDKLKELKGLPIMSLSLDPSRPTGRGQVLIAAHENTLRVFDLSTQRLTSASYAGADNHNSIVRGSYSACGKYVISGTDQGNLLVWDSKTGLRTSSSLDSVSFAEPINSVVWHPTQHCVAVCCYGGPFPVLMYSADRDPSKQMAAPGQGLEVGDGEEGGAGERDDVVDDDQRRALLEEKRKANRARYQELRDKALKRRQGEDEE